MNKIMKDYEIIGELAGKLGFTNFTDLQKKCFADEHFYNPEDWLFISGATGSGKTLVALLNFFLTRQKYESIGRKYKMLFAVPYRALASQKIDEITVACRALNLNLKISYSTSEYTRDDDDIMAGKFDIAIVINEKIFMFASSDSEFLSQYDLIVLDEFALTQDLQRGIKSDFVLLHAQRFPNIRIIVLGTPFYDWSAYLRKFNFYLLKEENRPIEIKEIPIFYNSTEITKVAEESGLQCEALKLGSDEIVAKICRLHLQNNERILVFVNNKEKSRKLSLRLKTALVRSGTLKPSMSAEECKKYLLDSLKMENDVVLYGSMDDEDFETFACGIAYHNANLPTSLRYLIERDFMNPQGHLKIICSTETLAYGVNTNADVVIIPNMYKKDFNAGISDARTAPERCLYPNEYMNYSGRAGRLNPSLPPDAQKNIGFVYPVFKVGTSGDFEKNWENFSDAIKNPPPAYSRFNGSGEDSMTVFYVLSAFSILRDKKKSLTADEIKNLLKDLPTESVELVLDSALGDLIERELIYVANEDESDEDNFVPEYKMTDAGKQMSGFVIPLEDYDEILKAVPKCVTPKKIFKVDIFQAILRCEGMRRTIKVNIGDLDYNEKSDRQCVSSTILAMQNIFRKNQKLMTPELYKKLTQDVTRCSSLVSAAKYNSDYNKIFHDKNFQTNRILAAILTSQEKISSPQEMYDNFKIHYEQIRRVAELMSYRLDIIRNCLKVIPGKNKKYLFSEIGFDGLSNLDESLKNLSEEIYYQPSREICEIFGVEHCDMYTAQLLKTVEKLCARISLSGEVDEKFLRREINSLPVPTNWKNLLRKNFGGIINVQN